VGLETALLAADRGAHVVVADKDVAAAQAVAAEVQKIGGKEAAIAVAIDIRNRESILQALRETVSTYGGLDIIVNTAAVFSFVTGWPNHRYPVGADFRYQCDGQSSSR